MISHLHSAVLALVLGLATTASAHADGPPDILGVPVGTKISDAMARIKATNPKFIETLETNSDFGRLNGKEFDWSDLLLDRTKTTWGLKERVKIFIGGVGPDEYVTNIGRDVTYDDTDPARPTVTDTVQALTAKYGTNPTARTSDKAGVTAVYQYDLAGKLMGPGNQPGCGTDRFARFDAPEFNGKCGLTVVWFVEPALNNPGLVREISVSIKDDQMFFKSLNERKAAVAAEQRSQVQGAKGAGVPKL